MEFLLTTMLTVGFVLVSEGKEGSGLALLYAQCLERLV